MATYDKMTSLKNPGRSVQVESAVRDGSGKNIENNYAKQNGYYSTLKAGAADLADFTDNITPYGPNSGIEDDTPFIFQSSAGESDIGSSAQIQKMKGISKAWNQLTIIPTLSSKTENGVIYVNNGDGSVTISTDENGATATTTLNLCGNLSRSIPLGHKVFITNFNTPHNDTYYLYDAYDTQTSIHYNSSKGYIKSKEGSSTIISPRIIIYSGTVISEPQTVYIQYFDLTLIYGAGNEPTTVDEFKQLFPLDYYDYDAGSIVSSKVKEYKVVGYNAFDGELEGNTIINGVNAVNGDNFRSKNYIKVIAGQTYTLEYNRADLEGYIYLNEYDANKNFIKEHSASGQALTKYELSKNTHFVRFHIYKSGSGWASNIPTNANVCLHLTWDESKTGYEPYWSKMYEFPNVELRGVNDIEDELLPDGTLTRRIGVYTFTGSETFVDWLGSKYSLSILISGIKPPSSNSVVGNIKWGLGITKSYTDLTRNEDRYEYEIALNDDGRLYIVTTKTSSELATALAGKTLIYELETPTTEQVNPYIENTLIDDWGTQEWLSDNIVMLPQPAELFYSVDYKAFIDSVGNRKDIAYAAENIVSQEQLTEVVNGTRPVNLADVATDIYSDREIEDTENACPPAVFSNIGGDAEIQNGHNAFEELRGYSVAFNQLIKNGNFVDTSNWIADANASLSINDNVARLTVTTNAYGSGIQQTTTDYCISGHKYLIKATCRASASNVGIRFTQYSYGPGASILTSGNIAIGTNWIQFGVIATATDTGSGSTTWRPACIRNNGTSVVDDWLDIKDLIVVDLTLMFGAGNEPTTVEEFNALFPEPYYDYNAGTLLSSKSTGLVVRGMNQFDGQWIIGKPSGSTEVYNCSSVNFIQVIPGETYALENGTDVSKFTTLDNGWYLWEYDENKNFIKETSKYNGLYTPNSRKIFTLSSQTKFVKFYVYSKGANFQTNGFPSTFMLRLYRNTDNLPFEPYEEEIVTLPNIELRSAGSISDVAYSTGGGKRRIGVVDLGTLNWEYIDSLGGVFRATINGLKSNNDFFHKDNLLCEKYECVARSQLSNKDKAFANQINVVFFRDTAYSGDAATFKTAMSGVYLFYELDTETDITTDENPGWAQYIKTNNYGTFEFTSEEEIQVPQAYFVKYTANLVEFLDSTYERAGGSANNIALVDDVTTVDEKHDAISEQLKEALGGTLRNCLAVKENLDFNDTAWVDVSTLTWVKQTKYTAYAYGLEGLVQPPSAYNVFAKALCSKYKLVIENHIISSDKAFAISVTGALLINDTALNSLDDAGIKEALINVLLAYEKAEAEAEVE